MISTFLWTCLQVQRGVSLTVGQKQVEDVFGDEERHHTIIHRSVKNTRQCVFLDVFLMVQKVVELQRSNVS